MHFVLRLVILVLQLERWETLARLVIVCSGKIRGIGEN